ncbi:Uncharacterised protein [Klebsiella michiganensis]|nr:Uncharacterised protein [Klebsiella michiganensis]STV92543.1 Uncharacterised protein [Klebsiella michiganensis]
MKKSCHFYNLLFYNKQEGACCTILITDNVKRTDMGRRFGAS